MARGDMARGDMSAAGHGSAQGLERGLEPLARRQHAFEEVAVLANPLEHHVHREHGRVEILAHLVPVEGRRDRRSGPRAN